MDNSASLSAPNPTTYFCKYSERSGALLLSFALSSSSTTSSSGCTAASALLPRLTGATPRSCAARPMGSRYLFAHKTNSQGQNQAFCVGICQAAKQVFGLAVLVRACTRACTKDSAMSCRAAKDSATLQQLPLPASQPARGMRDLTCPRAARSRTLPPCPHLMDSSETALWKPPWRPARAQGSQHQYTSTSVTLPDTVLHASRETTLCSCSSAWVGQQQQSKLPCQISQRAHLDERV